MDEQKKYYLTRSLIIIWSIIGIYISYDIAIHGTDSQWFGLTMIVFATALVLITSISILGYIIGEDEKKKTAISRQHISTPYCPTCGKKTTSEDITTKD